MKHLVPWFKVAKREGRIAIEGKADHLFGHKLDADASGKPHGVYAEWHWDGGRLVAANDTFGFGALFYYDGGDELMISTASRRCILT